MSNAVKRAKRRAKGKAVSAKKRKSEMPNKPTPIVPYLITDFIQARADVQPQPLGKGRIVSVIIQNRFNNMDGTGNNVEIMVGSGTGQIWQGLPGAQSPEIFARDLEDIYIRVRTGVTACDVVVFVYRERD